jgi:hypothetical protein
MTDITVAKHWSSATTAYSRRHAQASMVAGALLVIATLAARLLAVQSGHSAPTTILPAQTVVQQDRIIDQATEPSYFPGRPY